MPGYKNHQIAANVTAPLVVWAGWALTGYPGVSAEDLQTWGRIGAFTLAWVVAPSCFSGDMDQKASVPYKSWPIPIRWLWIPYQFFHHRDPWTHVPPISTIFRLCYILVMFWVFSVMLLFVVNNILHGSGLGDMTEYWDWFGSHRTWWQTIAFQVKWFTWAMVQPFRYWPTWCFVLGLVGADALHWVADVIDSKRSRGDALAASG